VDRVLVAGVESAQELQTALNATADIRVEELVSSSMMGAAVGNISRSALAGVVGALVS